MFNVGFTPVNAVPMRSVGKSFTGVHFTAEEKDKNPHEKPQNPLSLWEKVKLKYKRYLGVATIVSIATTGVSVVAVAVYPPATIVWQTVEGLYLMLKSLITVGMSIEYWKKHQENKFDKTVPKDKINTTKTIPFKSYILSRIKKPQKKAPD